MVPLDDFNLLQLLQCGDQQALVLLYDRYSAIAYRVALQILKNSAAAEDVVQDLFMQLWSKPAQLANPEEQLHGWMIVAARNRSISVLRRRNPDSLEGVTLTSPDKPHAQLEQRLVCETLINKLPIEQQLMMQMAFVRDMSYAEIAAATGTPLGTIKSRIRSALATLRSLPNDVPCSGHRAPLNFGLPA